MRRLIVFLVALGSTICLGQRQAANPHIGYIYPAGVKAGTKVDVTVGGQFLQGTSGVVFSGSGIQATLGEYDRPLSQKEAKDIGDKLQEARKKMTAGRNNPAMVAQEAGVTEKELRALARYRQNRTDPKRQLNPQIAETITVQIEVAPGAAVGIHELRLITPFGLTNPIRFIVGKTSQLSESEPNDPLPQEIKSSFPIAIDGQIMPGDVDRFTFSARKGTRLYAEAATRTLVPYLADAVPGWFQAALTLYGPNGSEIAYADHRQYDPEPVLSCTLPVDGNYTIEIRDALYRGREDFVYRLSLSAGSAPLPTQTEPASQTGIKEVAEVEPNDRLQSAEVVRGDCVISGRINSPGDIDVFRIWGRSGQKIVAEVLARRIRSPLDSALQLTDSKGRTIAFNDDWEDKGAGLVTHQADSYLLATLPADGAYYLTLRDSQHNGGPGYWYRLRMSAPRPAFELRMIPSSVTIRAGMSAPVTVQVLRRDGFTGAVKLAIRNAPPGFALSGAVVPEGVERVRLTLSAPELSSGPAPLHIEGTATINGVVVTVPAIPAEDMMQAFAYRHLVPSQELMVAVLGRSNRGAPRWQPMIEPLKIKPGATAQVSLSAPSGPIASRVRFAIDEAPDGIAIQSLSPGPNGLMLTFRVDGKVKPGLKGNLILAAFVEQQSAGANGRPPTTRRLPLGYVPAIPFEIVPAN